MPNSHRFRALQKRLTELRWHFLPKRFQTTGVYSDRQYDRVRAYVLLCHAELEACLEDIVNQAADDAFGAWCVDRRPCRLLLSLAAYTSADGPPRELPAAGPPDLKVRLDTARKLLSQTIHSNNGIRERNVLSLLLPIGVQETDFPTGWLAGIDSFGRRRGETAHQASRTTMVPDPQNELQTVAELAAGLATIDEVVLHLRTRKH